MPPGPIDPARLQGDDLTRWYLRTPAELEQERQAAEAKRYDEFFFGGGKGGEDPGSMSGRDNGEPAPSGSPIVDRAGAGPDDGGELIEIGNPANRRLKREYERTYGPWPKTEDGRDFHVAHGKAIADGGTNTLDNIRPMHPDEHIAGHMANGDPARWGRRPGIARAFGGTVARALGPLSVLSDISGIASGRIRTDSFDNFISDKMGWPSEADRQQQLERNQKANNPNWRPGDPIVI
ncbi:MAG: hypothetical protein JWM24_527 [Solirubrobacterales bacterium]|nr:hypothetical protein [Solirubrobacterales bacterium]